jgi:hypothetical protein
MNKIMKIKLIFTVISVAIIIGTFLFENPGINPRYVPW